MDAEALKNALEPWICVETWHTFHPLDEARFHRALGSAFASVGTSITKGDFEKAIISLAQKYHSMVLVEKRNEDADYWSQRAEHIASYLSYAGGI